MTCAVNFNALESLYFLSFWNTNFACLKSCDSSKKTHLVLNGMETGLSGQMTSTFIFKLYYKCMYSNLRLSATTKGS